MANDTINGRVCDMSGSQVRAEVCPQCGGPMPQSRAERLVCPYCGSTLIRLGDGRAAEAADEMNPGGSWGVCLKTVRCPDPQLGVDAFELLVPTAWEFQSGVFWNPQCPAMPAALAFEARNPEGDEAIQLLPNIACIWSSNPMIRGMGMAGMPYMGCEVREPKPAVDVLGEVVVARYRSEAKGLERHESQPLPELAEKLRASNRAAQDQGSHSDGGRVRLTYRYQGRALEEDLFGLVTTTPLATSTAMFTQDVFWVAEALFGFRAAAGSLDRQVNNFMTSILSFRLNPQWFQRYMQMSGQLTQQTVGQIEQVGRMSTLSSGIADSMSDRFDSISRTLDETSDMVADGWSSRQATLDSSAESFSQAIRGVDQYFDPGTNLGVELPGGYDNAWSNGLGEYIVSDVAGFDPNLGSTIDWQPMHRG